MKRPLGNRVAVRKYREKKKAHTAYLEEQVKKLRVLNEQLLRKLQRRAVLEAEVARLRGLLVHFRVKIDHLDLGSCPLGKQCDINCCSNGCRQRVNYQQPTGVVGCCQANTKCD